MSILDLLGLGSAVRPAAGASDTEAIRRITSALEAMEPQQARHVAAFAFILSRAANADLKISEEETRQMEGIVMEWGHLPEEQAVLVVQIAKSQSRLFGGTENFLVTREFKSVASKERKVELLHCLFAVTAADDSISTVEENEIWRIATEIGITHAEYVAIRSAYREKRKVLRDPPSSS